MKRKSLSSVIDGLHKRILICNSGDGSSNGSIVVLVTVVVIVVVVVVVLVVPDESYCPFITKYYLHLEEFGSVYLIRCCH